MNTASIRTASVAVSLVAGLALTGCGGGGGGSTSMAPADAAPTVRSGGGGGGPSAGGARNDPLGVAGELGHTRFTPLTAAVRERLDNRSGKCGADGRLSRDVHIERWRQRMAGDDRPGVGLRRCSTSSTELFPTEPTVDPGGFYSETDDGDEFWFWSEHSDEPGSGSGAEIPLL